jgi:hypothetical protein
MAITAAIGGVNPAAAIGQAGFRRGIDVGAVLVHLWIEMSDLQIRHESQPGPRKREGAKNAEKERGNSSHKCPSKTSSSCGFRNVGTLEVRPKPKSIRPK